MKAHLLPWNFETHFRLIEYVPFVAELYQEDGVDPKKKLDDLIHLAELCIEVLQQNEEYHAEVGRHYGNPSLSPCQPRIN